MKKTITLALLALSLTVSGCNSNSNPTDQNVKASTQPTMLNQNLPKQTLEFISNNGAKTDFQVEVASDNQQREIGLMNRTEVPDKTGMLFIFEKSGLVYFWMKNTLVPLDMVFIDENHKIKHIAQNVQPCLETNDNLCEKISSIFSIRYVVELPAGSTQKYNIQTGDTVNF